MPKPSGLWRRGKVWQYRLRIPIRLQSYFQGCRINRSLKTTSYPEAIKRSKIIAYEVQSLFDSMDAEVHPHSFLFKPIQTVAPYISSPVAASKEASSGFKAVAQTVTQTVAQTVAHEPQQLPGPVTLNDTFRMYMADPKHDRSPKTNLAYESTFSLLAQLIGPETAMAEIDRRSCRHVQTTLMHMPPNAFKRFPNLTLDEVIQTTAERDLPTLSPKSVNKHLGLLSTLFRWAMNEGMIETNPCSGLNVADPVRKKDKRKPFSDRQLQKVFTAPIYTGCIDDGRNFAKPGPYHPRRARFWVPLIGLYSGMRLNEICQLGKEDCRQIDGIWCFVVSTETEIDIEKRIKTANSERIVPVHPILIQIGWLKYVHKARRSASKRLFPDIEPAATGYLSDTFSKYFGRFLKACKADGPRTSFHSFRHNFRDALRSCDVQQDVGLALGGWASGDEAHASYGDGFSVDVLCREVSKVQYQGLDLKHLIGS